MTSVFAPVSHTDGGPRTSSSFDPRGRRLPATIFRNSLFDRAVRNPAFLTLDPRRLRHEFNPRHVLELGFAAGPGAGHQVAHAKPIFAAKFSASCIHHPPGANEQAKGALKNARRPMCRKPCGNVQDDVIRLSKRRGISARGRRPRMKQQNKGTTKSKTQVSQPRVTAANSNRRGDILAAQQHSASGPPPSRPRADAAAKRSRKKRRPAQWADGGEVHQQNRPPTKHPRCRQNFGSTRAKTPVIHRPETVSPDRSAEILELSKIHQSSASSTARASPFHNGQN